MSTLAEEIYPENIDLLMIARSSVRITQELMTLGAIRIVSFKGKLILSNILAFDTLDRCYQY